MQQGFASSQVSSDYGGSRQEALQLKSSLLPSLRAALPLGESEGMSPALRGGSVIPCAVRSDLRSSPALPWVALLQRCTGMVLVSAGWLAFLWGLANLILAALHNQQGELGLGMDSTVLGAKSCLASFLLCGVGVPQWVIGQRKQTRAYTQTA